MPGMCRSSMKRPFPRSRGSSSSRGTELPMRLISSVPKGRPEGLTRPLGGQRAKLFCERGGSFRLRSGNAQHRVDDALVARAPAEVSRDRDTNIVLRGVWAIAQELDERGYHSRGAEPALKAMVILKGLLQRMQRRRRWLATFI